MSVQKQALSSAACNSLYEASLPAKGNRLIQFLYYVWVVCGLSALMVLAWAEPWSAPLFRELVAAGAPPWLVDYAGVGLVMAARAILLVEAFGYAYHRFFQHVGFFTRQARLIRRNQRYHWIHHMIIYPIGRFYRRAQAYVSSEEHGLSWVVPGIVAAVLFIVTHGITFASVVFLATVWVYASRVVDKAHSRFHEAEHPWAQSRYFQWLERIHLLHHWDQRKNCTIVHPLMDILFGTYMAPHRHEREIEIALDDKEVTVSDLINWRYLLLEATPAEYAAFVSAARTHRPSLAKIDQLISILKERIATHPHEHQARDLQNKAIDLLRECGCTLPVT